MSYRQQAISMRLVLEAASSPFEAILALLTDLLLFNEPRTESGASSSCRRLEADEFHGEDNQNGREQDKQNLVNVPQVLALLHLFIVDGCYYLQCFVGVEVLFWGSHGSIKAR
jgi:hypothetical protein